MSVNLLTEHHLEFLSLNGGCTGSPESTHVKMPHCWKSHSTVQSCFYVFLDDWNKQQYNFTKSDFGKWELHIPPNPDGSCPIKHESKIKVGYCLIIFSSKEI